MFLFLLAGAGFADPKPDAAIGWLKSAQDPNTGEINQYGVWGTAWGVIALAQYGENESTLNKSLGYIANSQNTDGGIPYELGSPWGSGVDYSAPAILAFVSSNKTPDSLKKNNKTPMDFIWGTQGAGGGFGEWGEDVVSTSLAVMALSTIGENITKTGKDPIQFILSKQNSTDGGFEWWTTSEASAQALLALNSIGIYNQNTTTALYYLKSLQNPTTGAVVDPYVTALSAMAFHSYGWKLENELAVSYLKSVQGGNGRIGRTNQAQASDALTTALSALAFMNFSFGNVSSSSRMDANLSCSFQAPFLNETQFCTISVPQGWSPIYRYSIDGAVAYSDLPSAPFSGFSPGSHMISAAAFGMSPNLTLYTDIVYFNFTAIGPTIEAPVQNSRYNLGDAVEMRVSNATNLSVFFNGTRINGIITNLTYSARIENLSAGNYSLYFISPGFSEYRNFSVLDQYPAQNPGTNSPPSGGGGSYVTVEVEFPPNSGRHDISRVLNYGECEYAYECFTKVVPLECSWWSAVGGLACPGSSVSKTCLATGVDGVKAGSSGWWSFYTNGGLSAWGISCYKMSNGDKIKFKYAGEYKTKGTAQVSGAAALPIITKDETKNITKKGEIGINKSGQLPFIERGGFRIMENIGKEMMTKKSRIRVVSGAKAPCPECDFATALLIKAKLDELNASAEVTTDDRSGNCTEKETIIFVGGPKANRGVPDSYWNITASGEGAVYNITENCFVVAGNTRELTNKAALLLMETFK